MLDVSEEVLKILMYLQETFWLEASFQYSCRSRVCPGNFI